MAETWFQMIIREEVEKRNGKGGRGGISKLGREWGVKEDVVRKWLKGSDPTIRYIDLVLERTDRCIRRKPTIPEVFNEASKEAKAENDRLHDAIGRVREKLSAAQAIIDSAFGHSPAAGRRGHAAVYNKPRIDVAAIKLNESEKDPEKEE